MENNESDERDMECEHIFIGQDMLCRLCGIYFPERNEDEA